MEVELTIVIFMQHFVKRSCSRALLWWLHMQQQQSQWLLIVGQLCTMHLIYRLRDMEFCNIFGYQERKTHE